MRRLSFRGYAVLSFKEFLRKYYYPCKRQFRAPFADRVIVVKGDTCLQVLEEGKWIKASFDKEIRVDRATHLHSGEMHAHIHDRKGNELYALTQDGKPSHGSKPFKLSKDQASALATQGFSIPKNRVVEAVLISTGQLLLLE
jgi:hypothetical protein